MATALLLLTLVGCSGQPGAPTNTAATGGGSAGPTTASAPSRTTSGGSRTPSAPTTTQRTTSTLGALPPVLSSGPSAVKASAIRSLADLPAAFQCSSAVPPITVPPTADAPAGLVCASRLAGDEALFLWYAGDPDERYLALRAALAKAKYVRGGPNWVAASTRDPQMGEVGGDVYK